MNTTSNRLGHGLIIAVLSMTGSNFPAAQAQEKWDITVPRGNTREISFTTEQGTWMSVDISPDSSWVVFDLLGHIYRLPASGGRAVSLTQNSGMAVNSHPRISPDGREIAFVSDRGGQDNLWVMAADGSSPRPVFADMNARVAEPTWSPDGKQILVIRREKAPPVSIVPTMCCGCSRERGEKVSRWFASDPPEEQRRHDPECGRGSTGPSGLPLPPMDVMSTSTAQPLPVRTDDCGALTSRPVGLTA